jgi:hypothetical protein
VPGKDSGEKSSIIEKLSILLGVIVLIYIILWFANRAWSSSAPIAFVQPTSTFVPNPEIMIDQWVDVVVRAAESNPFDSFNVDEVVVRVGDSYYTDDGADGRFAVPCKENQFIYAWAPGYEIGSVQCVGHNPYEILLKHLKAVDNPLYIWSAAAHDCNTCHGGQYIPNERGASYDEMNEWFRSGHGSVLRGGYFESMYMGKSVTGKPSIPAEPVIIDNEWVPVPAAKSLDYHGPGFQLDFPDRPGNCAYCHVPASISSSQESILLSPFFPDLGGAWKEGVTCDICHKVFDVILADDQHPFPDRPGVLSYRFLRPDSGSFVTGPFSNLLRTPQKGLNLFPNHRSTCTPLFSQSEFCAPCHFGKFGDMVVYNSYGEWLESSFAKNPADPGYRSCQDCHMSHMDVNDRTSVAFQRQACSASNLDFQNFDHNLMDFGPYKDSRTGTERYIPRMLKGAAELLVTFGSEGPGANTLDVNVTVTNTKAGHKFPTDSPWRHLILVVEAVDRANTPLIQVSGGRLPNWTGPGPISPGNIAETLKNAGVIDYSGLAGKAFANLLVEEETNLSPGIAYWNGTKLAFEDSTNGLSSDTRLSPGVPDASTYSFGMPDKGKVEIIVRLIYRFAFYDMMVWKEWFDRADIVVVEVICDGHPREPGGMNCNQTEPPPATPTPIPTFTSTPVPSPTPVSTLTP